MQVMPSPSLAPQVPGTHSPAMFWARPLQLDDAHWLSFEQSWPVVPVAPRGMHLFVLDVPQPASQ